MRKQNGVQRQARGFKRSCAQDNGGDREERMGSTDYEFKQPDGPPDKLPSSRTHGRTRAQARERPISLDSGPAGPPWTVDWPDKPERDAHEQELPP